MPRNRLFAMLAIVLIASLVLSACGAGQTTAPTATPAPAEPTAAPAEPTPEPEPQSLGVVKIGTNAEYPPFESVDEVGNIIGFDIEIMNAIAEAAGFEFEFVNTRWDGIFVALASGEFDAVISAATITEERKQAVDFSDPYFNAGQMLAVPAGSDIAGPDDLSGKKVGVQLGTTGDIWVSDNTDAEVVRYDEITLAFQALGNGDVDAIVNDGPTSADIIKANPELGVTLVGEPFTNEFYGIAIRKDFPELLAALNEGLAAIRASGQYDAIYDTWFGVPEAAVAPPTEGIQEVVKIGTNAEYPPFESVDEVGNIIGFDIEIMNAIAEAAGFEFEFVNTRWDGIFVALASGEFDAVISAATITEERKQAVDFSDPYFNAGQMLAVPAGSDIAGPDDLGSKKVGVQLGTTGDIWVSDNTDAEVVRYDEITLAFQALGNGDVDAIVNDGPTSADIIKANPELGVTLVGEPFTNEFYGIAIRKDFPELLAALNEGLAAIRASGQYDAIYDTWFGTEAVQAPPPVEGVVKIGTNAEYPPFESVDEVGNIIGFDIEIMNAIAEAAGFEFEFVNTRWDGIFVALASGEFDAVISAATITEERKQAVDFSDPYFNAGQMLAVPAGSDIAGPDDLSGKKVGVQLGTTGDIWVSDNTDAEVVRYDEITLAFQALGNGDVDAIVNDGPTSADIILANPELGVTLVGEPFTDELYGIAIRKDFPELLAALNYGLAQVRASGEYDVIYDTWFGTE